MLCILCLLLSLCTSSFGEMAGILCVVYQNRFVRNVLRRERVFRDRLNPFDRYDDIDFKYRYRFSKDTVNNIIDMLEDELRSNIHRPTNISPVIQVTIALRFYCTGSFQRVVGDMQGISVTSACNIIHRVSRALALRRRRYIQFPNPNALAEVKQQFYAFDHCLWCNRLYAH